MIQFDEPAFNVYMDEVKDWGVEALHRAIDGLKCTTAVHICYGYGIKANIDWKASARRRVAAIPGDISRRWRQAGSTEVSVECIHSKVPVELLALLKGKDVQVGVIDVATDTVETPEEVAATIEAVLRHVPKERIIAGTNCGMAPMRRDIATAKLAALGQGAALARQALWIDPGRRPNRRCEPDSKSSRARAGSSRLEHRAPARPLALARAILVGG